MNITTKWVVFSFAGLISFWDVITTFQGMNSIFAGGILTYILTVVVNGILVFTYIELDEGSGIQSLAGLIWFVAFITDFATSYIGNMHASNFQEITTSQLQSDTTITIEHVLIIAALAIFTSGSTIFVSYFIFKQKILETLA